MPKKTVRRKFARKTKEDRIQNRKISKIERAISAEKRQHYAFHTATSVQEAGSAYSLVAPIAIGDDDGTRDSNSIFVYGVDVRYMLEPAPIAVAGNNTGTNVRAMLFIHKNVNTQNFLNNELLASQGNAQNYLSAINWRFINSYRVLRDKNHSIYPKPNTSGLATGNQTAWTGAGGETQDQQVTKFRIKFKKPLRVDYVPGATAGTYADMVKNNLLLCFWSADNGGYADVTATYNVVYTP